MSHELSITEIENEIDELEAKHGHKLSISQALDPAALLEKICAVVTIATPALKLAKRIFFFSKKIQNVIQKIIDISGEVCGIEE